MLSFAQTLSLQMSHCNHGKHAMSSMKDVAKLAGVSPSTVSRVISQKIPVDRQTQKRVKEAIKKLNYRPNLLAKGLRLRSGHFIGLVVPEFIPLHAFANMIKYTEESAAQHEFTLILGNHHDNADIEERFIDSLIRRSVDGIIFSRVSNESRVLKIFHEQNIPVVIIDQVLEDERIPSVVLNNYRAGELAAEHFVDLGHRHIACISGPLHISLCRERMKGFQDILQKNGIDFNERLIVEGDFNLEAGMRGAETLLRHHPELTAIWAHNDLMAAGVMKELYRRGVHIPEAISILGMDDVSLAGILSPELSTIQQPFQMMSEKAVEMIIMQKENRAFAEKKVIFEPTLVRRETTSPVV
ncbi:LacI family transcriptional regulator [candidate division KSB3 bacterium]|nr:MAG: LacI family transcriptional regulator [candidate division KSB3 bacterium]